MTEAFLNEWLEKAREAAVAAGDKILEVYHSDDFKTESKDDKSPLTLADRLSHEAIMERLENSGLPVLSEEGKGIEYADRKDWEYFWLVDPLDGTKEFIKRNGEFTVNIALVHGQRPVMGVVYVPVTGKMYSALKGQGAYLAEKDGEPARLQCATYTMQDEGLKMVGSRSHMNEETKTFMAQFKNPEVVSMGSSLKFMLVAEGNAHVYPRIAPTMEWDTGASQIIVEEAGGSVTRYEDGEPVVYNKENLLNPYFVVKSVEQQEA